MSKTGVLACSGCLLACCLLAGCNDNSPVTPPNSIPAPSARVSDPSEQPEGPQRPEPGSITPLPSPSHAQAAADELFAGWPKPQLLLVISGEQNGYIEPCGCAGLDNQKGGLARRHTFIKERQAAGWAVVPIDLGNQIHRFGPQSEIKFHTTIEGLKTIGYQAIGFGPDDLRMPVGELIADAANPENGFTSANVAMRGFEDVMPKYRVVERGGCKVAITTVLGSRAWQKVNNPELAYRPAQEALAEVVPKMREEANLLVLLSHGTPQEAADLARAFPDFRVIVTAGGADEPPLQPTRIEETGAWLVEVGHKGMYVAALGVYDDPNTPLRYQRVALDKRFTFSDEMHNLLVAYQGQLKARGFDGLGLTPDPHPSGRTFVGSKTCGECHTKAYEIWSQTPHAHATDTLVKLDPPRQFDPECVSCHATGWEPQKYYPFVSGFLSLDKTPLMTANGCENCHGPGSAHVAVEMGEMEVTPQEQTKLREQMRLPLAMAEARCVECHDLDNSPDFDFSTYWPQVEHHGKD